MKLMSLYTHFFNLSWIQPKLSAKQHQTALRDMKTELIQSEHIRSHEIAVAESIPRTQQRYYLERRIFL